MALDKLFDQTQMIKWSIDTTLEKIEEIKGKIHFSGQYDKRTCSSGPLCFSIINSWVSQTTKKGSLNCQGYQEWDGYGW